MPLSIRLFKQASRNSIKLLLQLELLVQLVC